MKITHVNCECLTPECSLRIVSDEYGIWINVQMPKYGLLRRIRKALRYIFKGTENWTDLSPCEGELRLMKEEIEAALENQRRNRELDEVAALVERAGE